MKKEVEIICDENFIAYCGLYCAACPRFLDKKCKGCKVNGASWCKVKPCNIENNYKNCSDCAKYNDIKDCKKYNPFLVKVGEFLSKTSRKEAVKILKERGTKEFAEFMTEKKWVSIKK